MNHFLSLIIFSRDILWFIGFLIFNFHLSLLLFCIFFQFMPAIQYLSYLIFLFFKFKILIIPNIQLFITFLIYYLSLVLICQILSYSEFPLFLTFAYPPV